MGEKEVAQRSERAKRQQHSQTQEANSLETEDRWTNTTKHLPNKHNQALADRCTNTTKHLPN